MTGRVGAHAEVTTARPRLATIDALRGVAALAVLLAHLPFSGTSSPATPGDATRSALPAAANLVLEQGQYGVHLFLIVSGFCIHMAWARDPSDRAAVSLVQFWKRRLHRLYPPYMAAVALSVLGLYVLHAFFGGVHGSLPARLGYADGSQLALDLLLLALLAQNLSAASDRIGNGPLWTLALEEQLYALYFPLLWMRKRWGWTSTLVVIGLTTLVWRTVSMCVPTKLPLLVLGPARWLDWSLGALAVEAHLGRVRLPAWCRSATIGVVLLAIALFVNNAEKLHIPTTPLLPFADATMALALFTLVNAACAARWAGAGTGVIGRFFAWVGTFSYSLYLTHALTVVAAKVVAMRAGASMPGIAIARITIALLGGWLFYMVVERRFLNASRRAASATAASPLLRQNE